MSKKKRISSQSPITNRKPIGYWNDFDNIECELLAFIEGHGPPGVMPTQGELKRSGRGDLVKAIHKHGGSPIVAEQLGLKLAHTAKPSGYWDDFDNVKYELLNFIKKDGTLGVIPTAQELRQAKQNSLASAISKHGGWQVVAERLGLKLAHPAKPSGYWDDFANVECELLAFIEEHGTPDVMPTQQELRKAQRYDLMGAIVRQGGYSEIAGRLDLKLTYSRKARGYWSDFNNLKHELLAFIEEHGTFGMMPTQAELSQAGRNDLITAISRQGGWSTVAERLALNLAYTAKPVGYWDDFANVERELLSFIEEHATPGMMPTGKELRQARPSTLASAISKHGGQRAVANKIGLKLTYRAKSTGYWDDFTNVERELLAFIKEDGKFGVMPTDVELREAGRGDLPNAINKHGGYAAVAKLLGLTYSQKPIGYWDDFANVEHELLTFINEKGATGVMPTARELQQAGYNTLVNVLQKYGGWQAVAERLGLELTSTTKPVGYWNDFTNVECELLSFIEEHGTPGVMPTDIELRKAGRGDLPKAIDRHGGYATVAKRLGLPYTRKPIGYWDDFANVEREILAFIEEFGTPGVMPTKEELEKAGLASLALFISSKYGGSQTVAERLGLAYAQKRKGYWDDFANVERELLSFIEEYGTPGVMPTDAEFRRAGRGDLPGAMQKHGGVSVVARRLDLTYIGPEYISPQTASEVERTARAIQPLAESNLLSPAQIMVILRRAGLLEFRNKRVVKLSASLARGDRAEIESAKANLVSVGEEITTETIPIEESDDLTAAEAEALVSGGLDVTDGLLTPPLKAPTAPDTEREQAVIRGLSALGQLRLPLDEILSLLTSKMLWQEFYKRLHTWYGSLDAAQTVTAEDVEAAILAAYPEHTTNEFVAEASALFTVEVEQAVNFAASLPDYGWHDPHHLHLHQADAARKMADALREHGSPFLLNADDPGMGKSASFLAAVAASGIRTVMLVAPKTVADDTWVAKNGEIYRCLPHARIVRGLDKTLAAPDSPKLTFFVLHYEELLNQDAVANLAEKSFDCLCLDEIHFIKQRAGQNPTHRREALEKLRALAHTAIGLTGTPLVNELAEPMSLLQTLSQHAPQFDHSRLSSSRLRDIADVFEALLPHIVRRRKSEVLLHLPDCDIRTVDIPLPSDLEAQMLTIYSWPKARASSQLVELRKLATDAKLPYLLSRTQTVPKLLVLTYLTDDVSQKIAAYLDDFLPGQIAHINGLVPKDERQKLLDSFRVSDGVRVLVGTIGTIGVGLTLFDPKQANTANEIIVADLPYTWAEFEQGIARLHREGQKHNVTVEVLQVTTTATLRDGSAHHTLDERIWALIEGKRELSNVAIDGKYNTADAAGKVQKALRRWLTQAREIGVEPLAVERRPVGQTEAQKWRGEIGRLRALNAIRADEVFADPEYTRQFLAHLETSTAAKLSYHWLRGKLTPLLRPDLAVVDMGCGLNPFADLPCYMIGLDRHDRPGQLRGKMENPPLPDKSADVLIYSLSLYGTAADIKSYFTHAVRILRGGGHLFIVEPASAFTDEGLKRFVSGLGQFGFEMVGSVKDLRGEDGTLLKGMHLTLTGEVGKPLEVLFERK